MKTIIIYIATLLTLPYQNHVLNDEVVLKEIKQSYRINENLKISLVNKADRELFYRIGIDCFNSDSNKWSLIVRNIYLPVSKSNPISNLKPHDSINKSFIVKRVINIYKEKRFTKLD